MTRHMLLVIPAATVLTL